MTLYEKIARAPLAQLARLAALDEAAGKGMTQRQRKRRTTRYLAFLMTLLATRPAASPYTLIEAPYCDGGQYFSEAALVETEAVRWLIEHMEDRGPIPAAELARMDADALEACALELADVLPPAVDYALLPWETVLGANVALPFWYGTGALLPALSSAIRTMSYAGFTKTQREKSQADLLAFMEARGEVQRLPAEEMEARKAAIRAAFPAPAADEQEALRRAALLDRVRSLQAEYAMYRLLARQVAE